MTVFQRTIRALPAVLCSIVFVLAHNAWAHENSNISSPGKTNSTSRSDLDITVIAEPPRIDGSLQETAWQNPPLPIGDWLTYDPLYGSRMPQQTKVWAAHDNDNLYFAFHCLDPEPYRIKSAISRRDTIWNDDWVGISLDSIGAHQSSYELFVNPDGIQGDKLNSLSTGEDSSPDWVWESAAQRVGDGYTVEIRIPLKSIRFSGAVTVQMQVLFMRRVSRLGMSASWPDLPPGISFFNRHASMVLHNVEHRPSLELMPDATLSLNQNLSSPGEWNSKSSPDGGITGKYGIAPSVILEGAFRPDFSQVESDAFQLEVNQRYPTFNTEKRPFFMEGLDVFNLAGTGKNSNMRTAVHTRRIADPLFGVKLVGTHGGLTFAALSALDRSPIGIDESSSVYREKKYFHIGRILYSIGRDSYIGGLVTDSELADGHNRVLAGDVSLRLGERQHMTATAIATDTLGSDGNNSRNGMAGQFHYLYQSKRQILETQFEHYDKDFQMDAAFYNSTGITTNWTRYTYNLYPDEEQYHWFKKLSPYIVVRTDRERIQRGNEYSIRGGLQAFFTRQGLFQTDFCKGTELWAGRRFNTEKTRIIAVAQPYGWLHIGAVVAIARSIYYDQTNPFSGRQKDYYLDASIQASNRLNQSITYSRVIFNRASNSEHIYTADLVNATTTYQFNRHFSVRAIERFDSSQSRLLMNLLACYELIPGTVAYAGYGASFDRKAWDGAYFVSGQGSYANTQRGLFFKVSYLYRL